MTAPIIALTGCTRGLGAALVRYFADAGAVVAGCGRSREAIERMREEFEQRHDFAVADVGKDGDVKAWARRVLKRTGAPHLLINNAALIARNAPIWELAADEADAVLSINISGTINVLRHFVPPMIQRTEREPSAGGAIVNFSSGWGRSTSPDVAVYCASKWAIEGLTRSLAEDLASTRVRAYSLNPGIVDTAMLRKCFGPSAGRYPSPERWVTQAGPLLLSLLNTGAHYMDLSLSVPDSVKD
jgi:NAD(P)-dependent dehydrogenase (short-subunit alcohol dehydrogenase family)